MTDKAYAATHCLVTTSHNGNYNIFSTSNANKAATALSSCCFDIVTATCDLIGSRSSGVICFGDEQIFRKLKETLPKITIIEKGTGIDSQILQLSESLTLVHATRKIIIIIIMSFSL